MIEIVFEGRNKLYGEYELRKSNRKTSMRALIASCCAMGAASAGASIEQIEQMRLFGEYIGIAFQIKDDLMDYGDDDIGKPTGIDLKEKKLTLPIIYTINNADKATRNYIINAIKNHHTDKKRVAEVIKYVNEHDGIAYTRKAMNEYKDKALAILAIQQNREIADKLAMLVEYIIDRKN
ncbi:MAG: polyprenyl synthetase family protein [Candidatus Methylacidiphilales bacterium]